MDEQTEQQAPGGEDLVAIKEQVYKDPRPLEELQSTTTGR